MIEDIAYLKENSVSDSMAFYIDSGTRDMKFWPTPAEYSISFEQPFRFVYGFDVLDGSIPTTQYNIDTVNNTLALTMFSVSTGVQLSTAEPYIQEIAYDKDFINLFEDSRVTYGFIVEQATVDTYGLATLSSSINSSTTYYAFLRKEITNVPIVLKGNQLASEFFFFTYNNKDYAIAYSGNTSIIDLISYGSYCLKLNLITGSTIVYFTPLKLDYITYNLLDNEGSFRTKFFNYRVNADIGNYDIGTLRNQINNVINEYDIALETTTPIESTQGRYRFSSSQKILVLNGRLTTLRENFGLSQLPSADMIEFYRTLSIGKNPYVYMSVYDDFYQVYKLEAPGLVNMFGERFVILKIKEIEDHLLGSYAYMSFSPGIGMFKLASSFNDVTNLRFDYTSLVRKPFHPIGKLHKLTVRFETAKGELYDFKGVNHQMLMVIKFLVPTAKVAFQRSSLNPNYNPNFIKYMANNQTIRNKEDSDDEEDFDDDVNRANYTKQMNKYEKGSSSDEDDESSSEEDVEQLYRERRLLPV